MHKNSASFFKNHPTVNEFYYTSDGRHFFNQESADAHARNLKKGNKGTDAVTKVTRAELDGEVVKIELSADDKKALSLAKGKVTRSQKLYDTAVAGGEQGAIDGAKIILDGAIAELQALPGYVAEQA